MSSEFAIIEDYFKPISADDSAVVIGIGDDGAVISLPNGKQLVVVTDTSIADVHFPKKTDPFAIAWKALAVNLSDLAAMGASPAFFSLALSLPTELNNTTWLSNFAKGLKALADKYQISLIGGDTTKSEILSITITANGWVENNQATLRSTAKVGDLVFVSGTIGNGGVGLKKLDDPLYPHSINQLNMPNPRVKLGLELLGLATSSIDISDGLLADLQHILNASNVSATINYDDIPFSLEVKNYIEETGNKLFPLVCGDDYELCFTIPKNKCLELDLIKSSVEVNMTCIGEITEKNKENICLKSDEKSLQESINSFPINGFKHFV